MKKTVTETAKTGLSEEQLARLREQSQPTAAGSIKLPVINRISINGNADAIENEKGELVRPPVSFRKMVMVGKDPKDRPEHVDLGNKLDVIFIKSRRRLVARDSKGFQTMSSSQHAHPNQVVGVWKKVKDENGIEKNKLVDVGNAKALRERYADLRTVQETYVLFNGELCLLIVKGAGLGSQTRDPKYPNFYEYLSALNNAGGIFAHHTVIGGVLEKGVKQFYTPVFKMGEATTGEELVEVLKHSDELTELIEKYDEENKNLTVDASKDDIDIGDQASVGAEAVDTEEAPF